MSIDLYTASDRAHSLKLAASKIDAALLTLESWEATYAGRELTASQEADYAALIQMAADMVWSYLVQREVNGYVVDREALLAEFCVPVAVRRRIGVTAPRGAAR